MYWCFVLHHHLQKVFRLIFIAWGNARPWTCLIFLPKHFCSSVKKNEHRKMTNLNHSHFYLRKLTRFWRYLGDDNVLYPFWNSFENVSVLEDGNYYTWTCHFGRNLCKVKRRQICWVVATQMNDLNNFWDKRISNGISFGWYHFYEVWSPDELKNDSIYARD